MNPSATIIIGTILNFIFPGLGFVFVKEYKKAVQWLLLFLATVYLALLCSVNMVLLVVGVVVVIATWGFIIIRFIRNAGKWRGEKGNLIVPFIILALLAVFNNNVVNVIRTYSPVIIYPVPTSSMFPTLRTNELVVARNFGSKEVNDVYTYDFSSDGMLAISRIMAEPGDVLQMKRGEVFTNGESIDRGHLIARMYTVKLKSKCDVKALIRKIGFDTTSREFDVRGRYAIDTLTGIALTTSDKIHLLKVHPCVISMAEQPLPEIVRFPSDKNWNAREYGPIQVPKAQDKIVLDSANQSLFFSLLREEQEPEKVYYGKEYEVDNDYYFLMGDNRDDSADSRYFGFSREDQVRRKLSFILWSDDSRRIGLKIE